MFYNCMHKSSRFRRMLIEVVLDRIKRYTLGLCSLQKNTNLKLSELHSNVYSYLTESSPDSYKNIPVESPGFYSNYWCVSLFLRKNFKILFKNVIERIK